MIQVANGVRHAQLDDKTTAASVTRRVGPYRSHPNLQVPTRELAERVHRELPGTHRTADLAPRRVLVFHIRVSLAPSDVSTASCHCDRKTRNLPCHPQMAPFSILRRGNVCPKPAVPRSYPLPPTRPVNRELRGTLAHLRGEGDQLIEEDLGLALNTRLTDFHLRVVLPAVVR